MSKSTVPNAEDLFGFARLTPEELQAMQVDKIRMDWLCARPIRMERLAWEISHDPHGKAKDLRKVIDDMMVATGYLPG